MVKDKSISSMDEIISLNVGGVTKGFMVRRSLLTSIPGSALEAMFSEANYGMMPTKWSKMSLKKIKNLTLQFFWGFFLTFFFLIFRKGIESNDFRGELWHNADKEIKNVDKNNNGTIEKKELQSLSIALNNPLTNAESQDFFKAIDKDYSGLITWREFITYWLDKEDD